MRWSTVLVLALCGVSFGQTPAAPTNLTYVIGGSPSGCNVALVSCVSQVNGVPVCPYGRVAWYPLPGQPYTVMTYPKVDQNGVAINTLKCVSSLRWHLVLTDPLYLTPPYFF